MIGETRQPSLLTDLPSSDQVENPIDFCDKIIRLKIVVMLY